MLAITNVYIFDELDKLITNACNSMFYSICFDLNKVFSPNELAITLKGVIVIKSDQMNRTDTCTIN